jgi:hypothetical protein
MFYNFLVKALNHVSLLSVIALIGNLAILLPLTFIKRFRNRAGEYILYSSFLFGFQLWLYCLVITLDTWGIIAVLIGLLIVGVGVVPIAFIASLYYGLWRQAFEIVIILVIVLAARIYGKKMREIV